MATTTYSSLRYPLSTASPNVNQDLQNLATDVDQKVTLLVANPTARNALSNKYDGMRVYEQSSKRYWRWDATASAWVYGGGAPPPITAVTVNSGAGGWTAGSGFAPGCYKDANGLVSVVGGVTNNALYTPASQLMMVLPSGFWPSKDISITIMAAAGTGYIQGGVYAADGSIKSNYNNSTSIGAGTLHTVNFSFHPGFAGGALA